MVSLLIDFVSHPKFLFLFEAKQAKLGKLGGQFRYVASKSFALFRFSFARSEIWGHPTLSCWWSLTTTKKKAKYDKTL